MGSGLSRVETGGGRQPSVLTASTHVLFDPHEEVLGSTASVAPIGHYHAVLPVALGHIEVDVAGRGDMRLPAFLGLSEGSVALGRLQLVLVDRAQLQQILIHRALDLLNCAKPRVGSWAFELGISLL